ncbi:SH3 domain-containing protein [Paramyrothecium foliicola]|nr:SH3 domain-containing protein [Paramyrothecium foliicola]
MQRVSGFLPSWEKRNSGSKGGGLFGWSNRSSAPNALSKLNVAAANSRVQRETLWPATLDLECDKAARILKSFCADGYLQPAEDDSLTSPTSSDSLSPIKLTRKIPKRVLQNAAGIAVFTCMRSGLWMTGSGGSGILIARKSDGTWSPPSGIMLHTPTLSFIIGVDVYDCVLVISNLAALESITRSRVALGEDVGLTSGPSVTLDSDEKDIKWVDIGNNVLSYVKSRGQLQLVNLNGCMLTERSNENVRFYSSEVTQMEILAGNVAKHVEETKPLFEVIKMAEGRTDYDVSTVARLASTPAPGDALIATPNSIPSTPRTAFGVVNAHDPDPFGVLALEMAGLEIREAGSRLRPSSSQFDINSAPLSPAFSKFSRQSLDTRSNRGSYMSARTVRSQGTDVGTQTDTGNTPETTPSPGQSEAGHERSSFDRITEHKDEDIDYTKVDLTPLKHLSQTSLVPEAPSPATADQESSTKAQETPTDPKKGPETKTQKVEAEELTNDADDEDDDCEDDIASDEDCEEPVVFEVASVQTASTQAVVSRVIHAKGSVVTIPKRIPPPLPLRSPARMSQQSSKSELGSDYAAFRSPLHQTFNESDLNDEPSQEANYTAKTSQEDILQPAMVGESDSNFLGADLRVQAVRTTAKSSSAELETSPADETDYYSLKVTSSQESLHGSKGDDESLSAGSTHSLDHTDNSDSAPGTKHTSFIYTGASEDRWSYDGSALTTPTTYSATDDVVGDDTPKKEGLAFRVSLNEERELQEEAVVKTAATISAPVA